MTNNINNLNFGKAVNFNSNERTPDTKGEACNCPECKQVEASSLDAMAAVRRMDVKEPYKFDPNNVVKDVESFEKAYAEYADEALDKEFQQLNSYALKKYGA